MASDPLALVRAYTDHLNDISVLFRTVRMKSFHSLVLISKSFRDQDFISRYCVLTPAGDFFGH